MVEELYEKLCVAFICCNFDYTITLVIKLLDNQQLDLLISKCELKKTLKWIQKTEGLHISKTVNNSWTLIEQNMFIYRIPSIWYQEKELVLQIKNQKGSNFIFFSLSMDFSF